MKIVDRIKVGQIWHATLDNDMETYFNFEIVAKILVEYEIYFIGIKAYFPADEIHDQMHIFNSDGIAKLDNGIFRLCKKTRKKSWYALTSDVKK